MLTQRKVDEYEIQPVNKSSLTTTYLEDKVKYYYEMCLRLISKTRQTFKV